MYWLILFMLICAGVKGQDLPGLTCVHGVYVVKSDSTIFCVPCMTCPEGMEPSVKRVHNVLYEEDDKFECVPCETGYYSDSYGTDSCEKCEICSKYEELCQPEINSVCQINSMEGTIRKHFEIKTLKINDILFALIICFTALQKIIFLRKNYFLNSRIIFLKQEINFLD